MTQKIDLKYYKDSMVQLMCPVTNNCTYVGKDGIQFHKSEGVILKNDYISHPKRNLFPFFEHPLHEDENGYFSNQLLELDQPYLFIYCDSNSPRFVERYLSLQDGEIYLQVEELSLGSKVSRRISKESLEEKLKQVAEKSKFLFFLDLDGRLNLMEMYKEINIPFSGIFVYENDSKIEAFIYHLCLEENQVLVEIEKVENHKFQKGSLESESFTIEPKIEGHHK